MKYADGFVLMKLAQAAGQASRTYWPPQDSLSWGISDAFSPEDWLEEYTASTDLSLLIDEMREDNDLVTTLRGDPKRYGQDIAIMRARVYEDGSIALYGKARKGIEAAIAADERPCEILQVENIFAAHSMTPPVAPPNFEAGRHSCEIKIRITDRAEFLEHFGLPKDFDAETATRQLKMFLLEPFSAEEFGARLEDVQVEVTKRKLKISITAEITDARLFNQRISLAARQCGFDDDYVPETAGDAIFEAWCGCNESPSPDTMGLEIEDWRDDSADERMVPSF